MERLNTGRDMFTALSDQNETPLTTHQTSYGYDQLNRIKAMTGYERYTNGSFGGSGYNSSYSYDPNGNLETLLRYISSRRTPRTFKIKLFGSSNIQDLIAINAQFSITELRF